MQKILIVKTSSLGDIIQTFPSLSYLRNKFPEAQIDWVVEKSFAELVLTNPDVSNVIMMDSKTWRKGIFSHWDEILQFRKEIKKTTYDVVFDLQGNVKSGFITLLARSCCKVGFGWRTVHEKPNTLFTNTRYDPPKGVNIREDYLLVVKGYFDDQKTYIDNRSLLEISVDQKNEIETILLHPELSQRPKVMVCPGSAWPNKQLPKETLIEFLSKLQNFLSCSFIFAWGTQAEQSLAQELQIKFSHSLLLKRLPLPVLQNLMDRMELVVAMDSLPLHLAGTTRAKTFSVFGPSLATKFKPVGTHHYALQGACPYGRQFEKRCPILRTCPTGACIRHLSAISVFESFHQQWSR